MPTACSARNGIGVDPDEPVPLGVHIVGPGEPVPAAASWGTRRLLMLLGGAAVVVVIAALVAALVYNSVHDDPAPTPTDRCRHRAGDDARHRAGNDFDQLEPDHDDRGHEHLGTMSTSPIAAARRRTELGLIVMAATITGVAYTLASLGKNAEIPPILVPFLIALLGLLVVAHLANRLLAKGADATILPLAALLHGVGYVIIARLSERSAGLQTTWTFVAILAYVVTLVVIQRTADLAHYQWSFLAIGAGLLLLPLVPGLGNTKGGAQIWVSLGPINFQPGEFAKIALALFFAGYLADHRELIASGAWRVGPFHFPNCAI